MATIMAWAAWGILIFWAIVGASYVAIKVKEKIAEQRKRDEEYEEFMQDMAVVNNMEKVFGKKAFEKFN